MSNPGVIGANIEQAYSAMPAPPCSTIELVKTILSGIRHLAHELENGQASADLDASAYPEAIALLGETLEGTGNQLGHTALAEGRKTMGTAIEARRLSQELYIRLSSIGGLMENLLESTLDVAGQRQQSQAAAAKYLTEIGVQHALDNTAQ